MTPDSTVGEDAAPDAQPDAMMDAAMDADAMMDAAMGDGGFVYDGAVPASSAVLFSETHLGGETRLITQDVVDLEEFADTTASLQIAAGYTLYGTSLTDFGGDLSVPYVGPATIDDLGALANTWDAIIFRQSSQPTGIVFLDTGATPKVYPLASFPSLGDASNANDGVNLPAGLALVGYDGPDFTGTMRGPYVGPLNVGSLPYINEWESLQVRTATGPDAATGQVILYSEANMTGTQIVLTQGLYSRMDSFPGQPGNFNNVVTSIKGRSGLEVWGFAWSDFGPGVFGPYFNNAAMLVGAADNEWDSVVIRPINSPQVELYVGGGCTTKRAYPIVDVPNLRGDNDATTGVIVPVGYVVYGFDNDRFGGDVWQYTSQTCSTVNANKWTSFMTRPLTEPTATIYMDAGGGNARVYPLARYEDLNAVENAIDGVSVPCGIRVIGYDNESFTGTQTTVTVTTTNLGAASNTWNSMIIERVPGAVCP